MSGRPDVWRNRSTTPAIPYLVHATTIAFEGRAMMLGGPAGSGKTGLALEMMHWGAQLVADDMTEVRRGDGGLLWARAPEGLRGKVELREIGIAHLPRDAGPQPLSLAVDLSQTEAARLPPPRRLDLFGQKLVLLHKPASAPVAAKLLHYLKAMAQPETR